MKIYKLRNSPVSTHDQHMRALTLKHSLNYSFGQMLEDMSIESISRIKELDKNKSNLARFKFDKNLLFR